jgi:hypothetical protein
MTTMKSVILAAALGLASMTFASAKTYNVVLSTPTQVGKAQLAAGAYKLNLDGHVATFTSVSTSRSIMVLVHFTSSDVNFEHTALDLINQNGTQRMEAIELEDSNNKLEF